MAKDCVQWGIERSLRDSAARGGEGEVEPVSGRHFVNNEDVFAIFKFLQMFFHPDPNPKEARRRRNENPSSCIHFCLSAKRRTDRRTDAQLEGNWGIIPGNVAKGVGRREGGWCILYVF